MATAPVRSQPLHNFSLPFLKWGKNHPMTNHQRCRKSEDDHRSSASEADSSDGGGGSLCERESELDQQRNKKKKKKMMNSNPINTPASVKSRVASSSSDALMEKASLMMKTPIPIQAMSESDTGVAEEEEVVEKNSKAPLSDACVVVGGGGGGGEREAGEESAVKPWNLRPRRVAFKGTVEMEGGGGAKIGELTLDKSENHLPKSLRLRGIVDGANVEKKKKEKEKRKFWISLSRDEIEEDFFVMTGSKPSRRPKKRAKNVQRSIDNLLPGLWLAGITAESYIVPEFPTKL